jgi:hypothetical protein
VIIKIKFIVLILCMGVINSFAQKTPEELSNKFTSAFFHNDTFQLKAICPSDTKLQQVIISKLDQVYQQGVEAGIKWNLIISASSAATLKEDRNKTVKKADIVISFKDKGSNYKISIWDCEQDNGLWKLGSKILLKKV